MVDPDDPDFHHSIAVALVAQNKSEIASFAYLEAIRRKPANQVWRAELSKITAKHHSHPTLNLDPIWQHGLGLDGRLPVSNKPSKKGSGQTPRANPAPRRHSGGLATSTPLPEASHGDTSAVADEDWHTPATGEAGRRSSSSSSGFSDELDELDEIDEIDRAAHAAHAAQLTLASEAAAAAEAEAEGAGEKIKLTPPPTLRAESPSNIANVRLTQMQEM